MCATIFFVALRVLDLQKRTKVLLFVYNNLIVGNIFIFFRKDEKKTEITSELAISFKRARERNTKKSDTNN